MPQPPAPQTMRSRRHGNGGKPSSKEIKAAAQGSIVAEIIRNLKFCFPVTIKTLKPAFSWGRGGVKSVLKCSLTLSSAKTKPPPSREIPETNVLLQKLQSERLKSEQTRSRSHFLPRTAVRVPTTFLISALESNARKGGGQGTGHGKETCPSTHLLTPPRVSERWKSTDH